MRAVLTAPTARLTLARRDLAARGAPWAVVDEALPENVGDLWAQVTGTGHPVLWRIGTTARVEEWCCTGPWGEGEALAAEKLGPPGDRVPVLACVVAAREIARAAEEWMGNGSRRALLPTDRWLSGEATLDDLRAANARAHSAWAQTRGRRLPDEWVRAAQIATSATGAAASAAEPERLLFHASLVRHGLYAAHVAAGRYVKVDTRAVILRALGVRPCA